MAAISYPCFWLRKDLSGAWYWVYHDGQGEIVARSSSTFARYDDCRRSVDLIKGAAQHPVYYSR
jgi:uncharacterized protein YegP (UPF0339 family)